MARRDYIYVWCSFSTKQGRISMHTAHFCNLFPQNYPWNFCMFCCQELELFVFWLFSFQFIYWHICYVEKSDCIIYTTVWIYSLKANKLNRRFLYSYLLHYFSLSEIWLSNVSSSKVAVTDSFLTPSLRKNLTKPYLFLSLKFYFFLFLSVTMK